MRDIHSTGEAVDETSYYTPLANLLNEIGKTLKPKVHCVINLKNRGAGIPDGGLFTPDQLQKGDENPMAGQIPARGAMEVKPPAGDVHQIVKSVQVKKYFARYGLVLVTTYREFLLVGQDDHGKQVPMEAYRLARDEKSFWQAVGHPKKTTDEHGTALEEYLKRAMLHAAPLTDPKDVAWFLASYARQALGRVEQKKDLAALSAVRSALEESLGMKFIGPKGEHFFRSTLVQTLFYGLFSAWVLWHAEDPDRQDDFNWHEAGWYLRVPFIRALYEEVARSSRLGPLGLVEVLDWAAGVLNRVNRAEFFKRFEERHAVQYFYEPFLEAFDPDLRKELGVWYTPEEIVRYQVERIDTVLREELDIEDGLADSRVVVLDPCCGTGTYLLEVLNRIAKTLREKGDDALIASDLKQAAMERLFGFEILPAPFVVSHLQLGLLLTRLGAPLRDDHDSTERVGVYLTNALTGWEPPKHPKKLLFPELQVERDAAGHVKRDARILVILGNPPYNAFAGVSPDEEQGLVELYKGLYYTEKTLKRGKTRGKTKKIPHYLLNDPVKNGGWGIKKFNLDDLYIRFFRLAERRIAEMSGKGVVSFISNFSYLSDPSFVVMRQRFLSEFDTLWFDCMNGDSRETGKLTPEGKPDPSVFSTEYNREGIRVGTTVGVIVRKEKREKKPKVLFRHFWGVNKRQDLLDSFSTKRLDTAYTAACPSKENRYSFRPENVSAEYNTWPSWPDLATCNYNGPVERRAGALISIERNPLEYRMKSYFDPNVSNGDIKAIYSSLMMTGNRIVGPDARKKILSQHSFSTKAIVKYPFKVFDIRWSYLENLRPLFSEPSPELLSHRIKGNGFFITRDTADKTIEGPPFYYSPCVCDYDCISGHARHFPVLLAPTSKSKGKKSKGQTSFLDAPPKANLSPAARVYLTGLGIKDPDAGADVAWLVWMHALAIGYSPVYLEENADGIRRDWPRVPLPGTKKELEASAELGRTVAALLDTESDLKGVTSGQIGPEFKTIGVICRKGGGSLDPAAGDLAVTAGWGHAGKGGVTMPGRGEIVERKYETAELEAIRKGAKTRGQTLEEALTVLGADTRDVYLSEKAYWKNIPANVWGYYIGGYQVIKKWLSYREQSLLGRALKAEEAKEVMNMARRLAAIALLQPKLDANYQAVKAKAYTWPREENAPGKGETKPKAKRKRAKKG